MRALALVPGLAGCLLAQQMSPLVGDVVDENRKPVPDAVVIVSRGEGRGFNCLDLDYAHSWREVARTPVDRTGHFGVQLPIGLCLRVEVEHPGHARWRREGLTPGEHIAIELEPPRTFRGSLRHRNNGNGTPGYLRAWDVVDHTELFAGRTDAAGRFEFANLPARPFVCDVAPDEAMAPPWFRALWDGATLQHDFLVEDGSVLTGHVTDADTGKPIAGARIGEGWTLHKAVTTDADGRYELRGHGGLRPDLHCRAAGYVAQQTNDFTANGAVRIDFTLLRGAAIRGLIADANDKPVPDVYVAAVIYAHQHHWVPARTDARGAFALEGLPPHTVGTLLLRRDGYATAIYALPPVDADRPLDLGRLRMQSPKVVRGVLLDDAGHPLAGTLVTLCGTNDDRDRFGQELADWRLVSVYLGERQVRTNDDGVFGFGDVAPGDYTIRLGMPGEERTLTAVGVAAKGDPDPLRLVLR